MTANEIKAIKELQDKYEYHWNNGDYEQCKALHGAFCILNKYLTGNTSWKIQFEGSKADELVNVRAY